MKKLMIVTVTIVACSAGFTTVRAKDARARPSGMTAPQERLMRLNGALLLTPDQQDKIRAIWIGQRSDFERARALPPNERRQKVRETVRMQNDSIAEVLNREQKEKFKELLARRDEAVRAGAEEQ